MANNGITSEKIEVWVYILNIHIISTPFHSAPLKSPCCVYVEGKNRAKANLLSLACI